MQASAASSPRPPATDLAGRRARLPPGRRRGQSLVAGAAEIQDVPQVLDNIFYVAATGLAVAGFGTMFGSGLLDPSNNSLLNSDGGGLGGPGPKARGSASTPSTKSLDEIYEEQEKARRKRGKKFWE